MPTLLDCRLVLLHMQVLYLTLQVLYIRVHATGIVTVTTAGAHGLNVNNPFKIVGVAQTIYNTTGIVK